MPRAMSAPDGQSAAHGSDPYAQMSDREREARAVAHMKSAFDEDGREQVREFMRRFGATVYTPGGGKIARRAARHPEQAAADYPSPPTEQ